MREIPFSIPISGIIRINGQQVTVIFQQTQMNLTVNAIAASTIRFVSEDGTISDIVLEIARKLTASGKIDFSAADLYKEALKSHPDLKRNSWGAHVIASAPNHNSYKHYSAHRDYFDYTGQGKYRLRRQYLK